MIATTRLHTSVIVPTYGITAYTRTHQNTGNTPLQRLSVCRLEERKGLQQVVDSLAKCKDLPNYEWHIIGNGPLKETLKQRIQTLGLTHCVHLHGHASETQKQSMYQNADLYVMPSYQAGRSIEGFGISCVEAAQLGIPSIAGVDGGVTDAVIHGLTGWCVNPNNQSALEKALREAMINHQQRLQFGSNAALYYAEHFSPDIVFKKLIDQIHKKPVTTVS